MPKFEKIDILYGHYNKINCVEIYNDLVFSADYSIFVWNLSN